jgi:hypothetical protein
MPKTLLLQLEDLVDRNRHTGCHYAFSSMIGLPPIMLTIQLRTVPVCPYSHLSDHVAQHGMLALLTYRVLRWLLGW